MNFIIFKPRCQFPKKKNNLSSRTKLQFFLPTVGNTNLSKDFVYNSSKNRRTKIKTFPANFYRSTAYSIFTLHSTLIKQLNERTNKSVLLKRKKISQLIMGIERGALIVLEGCDKAGKSTQVKKLVEALTNMKYPAEIRQFPNRSTAKGALINEYLTSKVDIPQEKVVSLFSANRWEFKDDIEKTLLSGKTIVVDRYAASGAAYGAVNTGRSLDWCKKLDKGLPAPDLVVLLRIDKESQALRSGWGEERFESEKFQRQVAENFLELVEDSWKIIENEDLESTHTKILEAAINVIKSVGSNPIKSLYES